MADNSYNFEGLEGKNWPLRAILLVSVIAMSFLVWLIYFNKSAGTMPEFIFSLPAVNATFNALSALFLVLGVLKIKKGDLKGHIKFLSVAFIFSTLFLVSYIIYHFYHGDTKFLATGLIRPIYFFILISHILLSIVALPLVLYTYFLGITKNIVRHKKLVRFTFPIWLYVSTTGVVIFLILKLFQPK